ncbi:MAG: oligosaccharide flippase family protein [Gorillibacterium sp.]|nr:oligosaccharide flippase family protein [Gorillibacterium sp.]
METSKSYLKGAAVLGTAAVLSKLLGTVQKIPLQNLAGEEAFGIYNIVYPLYTLILTLAIAGFPLTVSAFVSEKMAMGSYREARRILFVASVILAFTGILFFIALYAGADQLSLFLGAPQTAPAIRSVSWALLLVPVMAALRGYFQGCGNMVPTALSQVAEQLVRVAVMLVLLFYYLELNLGADRIAAGATFGSTAGALSGLMVMLFFWRREQRRVNKVSRDDTPTYEIGSEEHCTARKVNSEPSESERVLPLLRRFFRVALPICFGSIALPALTLVDSVTLPRLLTSRGVAEAAGLYQIGLFNHAQPLVQLVALIATSMSAALVPAVAFARLQGETAILRRRTEDSVRAGWLVGFAASFGLAAASIPINIMLFKTSAGSGTMSILAFTAAFATLQIVTGSVLIGYNASRLPAIHLFAATIGKVLLNLLLVPAMGISGAAWASVAAYAAAALLNLAALSRLSGVRFTLGAYVWRPLAAASAMCCAVFASRGAVTALAHAFHGSSDSRGMATLSALLAVTLGAAVYMAALLRLGCITRADLEAAPSAVTRLIPLLEQARLLARIQKLSPCSAGKKEISP